MPDRLTDLTLNRVAFVGRGDNPEADIVLWKAADRPKTQIVKEAMPKRDPRFTQRRVDRLRTAWESIGAVIEEAGRKEDTVADDTAKHYTLPDDASDELRTYVESLQADAAAARAELGKAVKSEDKPDDDEVTKALADVPVAVRDLVAKQAADIEAATKAATEATAKVEKMQTDAEVAEAIAKAKDWRYLRLDADKVGPELQKLRKADPKLAEEIEQALDSANGTSSEAFKEIGKGSGSIDATDAESEFSRMVEEARKADNDLTKEQAFAKVASTPEGQKAYAQIEEERKEG